MELQMELKMELKMEEFLSDCRRAVQVCRSAPVSVSLTHARTHAQLRHF